MFAVSEIREGCIYVRKVTKDAPTENGEILLPSAVPVPSLYSLSDINFSVEARKAFQQEISVMRARREIRAGVREKCLPPA